MNKVPVLSLDNKPLMPTSPSRARRLIKDKKATPFYKLGVFCIKLHFGTNNKTQSIAVGIDPGSKKEAYTVKSSNDTYLNIQCDAVSWVKDNIESRRNMRRARRFRNTPYRKPRWANRGSSNRSDRVPPSTKARYDLKLGIISKLQKMYPITGVIVEDLKAESKKGKKRWNKSFSPLQVGKDYFYRNIRKTTKLCKKSGYYTSTLRKNSNLGKTKHKMSEIFDAHCVDSWVLANDVVGGHIKPDNENILFLKPYKATRRQLHYLQYSKGFTRPRFGGTRSLGFKKGSIVKYVGKTKSKIENGKTYLVGGFNDKGQITLCSIESQSDRLNRTINPKDCKFVSYNKFSIKVKNNVR
jgi:hypothetical protein